MNRRQSKTSSDTASLTLQPIGYMRTAKQLKFDAPSQPENSREPDGVIELVQGHSFEQALKDLAGFDRIWILWWFHRNSTWRPLVLPPRGQGIKRGVFATRSPHRPNPIGMSAVPLLGIKGRTLQIGQNDLIDGTPILDIKPYIEEVDSFVGERQGWLEQLEEQMASPPLYEVILSDLAAAQVRWLRDNWGIDFMTKATALLARDPTPHKTRRIVELPSGEFRMGCGAWRVFFSIQEKVVTVRCLAPGYPRLSLEGTTTEEVPQREAQVAFLSRWATEVSK